jgi:hypothetical protein
MIRISKRNFDFIDLPDHHPMRMFILATIEHDEKKRLTSPDIVSKLQVLSKSDSGERNATDPSITDKLINNREQWNFAQVWEINKPSVGDLPSTSFCNRVANKYPIQIQASFMVKLENIVYL